VCLPGQITDGEREFERKQITDTQPTLGGEKKKKREEKLKIIPFSHTGTLTFTLENRKSPFENRMIFLRVLLTCAGMVRRLATLQPFSRRWISAGSTRGRRPVSGMMSGHRNSFRSVRNWKPETKQLWCALKFKNKKTATEIVLVIWAVGELGRIGSLFCCRFGCERLVVSMAVHGTLNPELGAKARVDIYEGGGGQEEEGGVSSGWWRRRRDTHTHTAGRLTHLNRLGLFEAVLLRRE
jgi:hypothetical protein